MEKLSLKITYYFITHIATEYEQHLEHLEQYQNNPGENPHIKGMDNLSVCMWVFYLKRRDARIIEEDMQFSL